jgi:hypothetical protein
MAGKPVIRRLEVWRGGDTAQKQRAALNRGKPGNYRPIETSREGLLATGMWETRTSYVTLALLTTHVP